jgi:hypothetical protein
MEQAGYSVRIILMEARRHRMSGGKDETNLGEEKWTERERLKEEYL